jgi:hypothetical protein
MRINYILYFVLMVFLQACCSPTIKISSNIDEDMKPSYEIINEILENPEILRAFCKDTTEKFKEWKEKSNCGDFELNYMIKYIKANLNKNIIITQDTIYKSINVMSRNEFYFHKIKILGSNIQKGIITFFLKENNQWLLEGIDLFDNTNHSIDSL